MKIILAILLVAFALHSDAGAFWHGIAAVGDLVTDPGFSPPNDVLTTGSGDPLIPQ